MLAADDAGSTDATLERMEGIETRDVVRNGHRGGDSGDAGVDRSVLGLGVASSGRGVVAGLERGDFAPDPFLSLPFPRTFFLRLPFLFRLWTSAIAPRVRSLPVPSLFSSSVLERRRLNLDSRLPEMERLWLLTVSPLFFVLAVSFSTIPSSSMFGKGVGLSGDSAAPLVCPLIAISKMYRFHGVQNGQRAVPMCKDHGHRNKRRSMKFAPR